MNLKQMREALKLRGQPGIDPALLKHLDTMIADMAGEPAKERRFRSVTRWAAACIYLGITAATAAIVLAATLQWLKVDNDWLKVLWVAFTAEFVPLAVVLFRVTWKLTSTSKTNGNDTQ